MKTAFGLVLSIAAALAVAGCSETKMQDLLGSGKSAVPDETQVRTNRNLAMPPDLNLRPPSGEVAEDGQLNTVAAAPPAEPAMDKAQPTPEPAPEPVKTAAATPPTAQGAEPPKQDVYEKYGISKTGPDGKPKSENQLYKELHEAQLAEKRKANPNYGTIWNMGNVFKDE
ncbi:hypothetical protein G5V57_21750 [Nordella sp. HKS 07]|uniref:hypothetical protein n=1 Tax=Nordella sp. HKS 07 TaxID=2712222 RepID=UPI0013E1D035|nr:hypothetical protein [Nordella sp. HKS 07]QIG50113.1 hypothetical protein G5V57_21750 [Nordella sp. HKS 07]